MGSIKSENHNKYRAHVEDFSFGFFLFGRIFFFAGTVARELAPVLF